MNEDKNNTFTIAFYNIENLFDTVDDIRTNDDDFLPDSKKRWTEKRYNNKLIKIGNVISSIGVEDKNEKSPAIVGLAEVENKKVLNDLVRSKTLINERYSFIHYDSSDERGIDVALLYDSDQFKITETDTFSVYLEDEFGKRDYTRDILLVRGILLEESITILVNHWSSRRQGVNETEHKRIAAAKKVNSIIHTIITENPYEKIIVMGDFNDNPNDKSLKLMEEESKLFNPFKTVWSKEEGSLSYDFEWHLFDQILYSTNFFDPKSKFEVHEANIFNSKFLTQYKGKFQGQPFRTYVGKKYKGGYSDHFPVYLKLKQS